MTKLILFIFIFNLIQISSTFASVIDGIDEDTPVELDEIAGDKNLTGSRPWRVPDYSNQKEESIVLLN